MAEDREYDFYTLLENLKITVTILAELDISTLVYARDYTKAFKVESLITGLLANIKSLIEAAKAVQDVSRPITEEILTVSLCLRNKMFQYQSDLRRCMDGSKDDIGVFRPRNIYDRIIPHVSDIAQEYSTIFHNLRFKVEAESEMQKQQSTEESQEEPGGADNEPEVIEIDLKGFNKSLSFNLLTDLIVDVCRDGVTIDKVRHGKKQPQSLKDVLKNNGYEDVAKKVKLRNKRITLDIPFERITTDSQKTAKNNPA
jgi:hypothetical protein